MVDFDKKVFQAFKPGGMFFVLDHAIAPDRGVSDTLRRIDPHTARVFAGQD